MSNPFFDVLSFWFSQVSFGVKAGVNFTKITLEDHPNDFRFSDDDGTGFHFGAFVGLDLNSSFGLQTEALYSREGIKDQYADYINIPVFLKWYPVAPVHLGVGPQIGFLANTELIKGQYENVAFGALINLGADIADFTVSARYVIGLSNVLDREYQLGTPPNINPFTIEGKENNFQLSLGYTF